MSISPPISPHLSLLKCKAFVIMKTFESKTGHPTLIRIVLVDILSIDEVVRTLEKIGMNLCGEAVSVAL